MLLEAESGERRAFVGVLCAAMAALFLAALLLSPSRRFFDLASVDGSMLGAWAAGSVLAVVLMRAGVTIAARIGRADQERQARSLTRPTPRPSDNASAPAPTKSPTDRSTSCNDAEERARASKRT
jgi:hypothetical protein